MPGLYVGSTSGFSGKNLMTVSLGLLLQQDGLKVGYMKPVGAMPRLGGGDKDADFIQSVLGLEQSPKLVTPVVVDQDFLDKAFSGQCQALIKDIESSYAKLKDGKDVTLVGGSGSLVHSGKYCGLDGISVVRRLGLKALVVDRYADGHKYDYLLAVKEDLGGDLAGVVLNDVPDEAIDDIKANLVPFLERQGVPVLGIIPSDSFIGGIKVGELAARLKATIISAEHKTDAIVENALIGTMQVENFMTHFQRQQSSAVIVGGDRSDIQLVALEGSCPCIILTGNLYPNGMIVARSEDLGIPIIVAKEDTFTVAKRFGQILARLKFNDNIKINRGFQLVKANFDLAALKKSLGL